MRRLVAWCAVVLACGCVAPAVAGSDHADKHRSVSPVAVQFLHVATGSKGGLAQIVDSSGRQVLLRGVNVNGLEDYYSTHRDHTRRAYPIKPSDYTHGRCPNRNSGVESMTVCSFDATQWKSYGYDVIRLGLSWSQLEPEPGHISRTYIARIAQVVGWARRAGVYVVLDMHQDAWSKYLYTPTSTHCPPPFAAVGNGFELDGAPKWASTHLTPVCDVDQRELDAAVAEDFQRFYDDAPAPDGVGLQEHFANVFAALAKRFGHNPAVAGYELFNEPNPGLEPTPAMDETTLFPFYAKVIARMRVAVPHFHQLVFIEPDITRDITDQSAIATPWSAYSSYRNVVFSPHVYTRVFTPDADIAAASGSKPFLPMREGYDSAVRDAKALGLPLWVGEFGNNVSDDPTVLKAHYNNQDSRAIGSALWVWKQNAYNAKRTDGFAVMHQPFGRGRAFPSRIRYTSRVYPRAVAGRLMSLSYDVPTRRFRVVGTSRRVPVGDVSRATVLFVPARVASRLHAEGAHVVMRNGPGRDRYALVYPLGGRYVVTG